MTDPLGTSTSRCCILARRGNYSHGLGRKSMSVQTRRPIRDGFRDTEESRTLSPDRWRKPARCPGASGLCLLQGRASRVQPPLQRRAALQFAPSVRRQSFLHLGRGGTSYRTLLNACSAMQRGFAKRLEAPCITCRHAARPQGGTAGRRLMAHDECAEACA